MNANDKPTVLTLELEPEATAATLAPSSGKSVFHANTRGKSDRRVQGERRQEFRLQPDRRTGADRRPRSGWQPGSNL